MRLGLIVAFIFSIAALALAAEPYALHGDKFLFLDEFLLDAVDGAELVVNPPANVKLVVIADKPWERGGITSYGNVLYDEAAGEYRLYYVPVAWDVEPGFCYALATSKDGVNWEKPNLGVVEWQGSKDNNIVIWAQREGTVLIDPNAPPESRYAIISSHPELKTRLFISPDGVHFTMNDAPISGLHSDSQISSFWDKDKEVYFHYPRVTPEHWRATGVVTTKELSEPWPEEIPMVLSGDARDPVEVDLYTNACQKYGLAPNCYVGFPTPYYHWNAPGREYLNEATLAIGGKTNDGMIDTQLATSRDGIHWTRHRQRYIPIGYYDGCDVKVAMAIPGILYEERKLVQYFMGYTFTHGDTQVRYGDGGRDLGGVFRVEQRVDGFISLDFDYEGGRVLTGPFTFDGARLTVNVNTSAPGELRVALLDEGGSEVPGFGIEDARIINGNHLEWTVQWAGGAADVSALRGKSVRLLFDGRAAQLYSFQFRPAAQETAG